MSLSRYGEKGEWFTEPGYVYVTDGQIADYRFNEPIHTPATFCELAMRALDQSGEVDEETLEQCADALESRFDFTGVEYNE